MTELGYTLRDESGDPPRLGLIVLQVDETVEEDFRRLLPPDRARLHVTRIPSGAELTPDTIAAMSGALRVAASLLPEADYAAIGYACTSASTLIGPDAVAREVRAGRGADAVSNPLDAARAAAAHLGLSSLAIVSPYVAPVAEPLRAAFEAGGLRVTGALSFGEKIERNVARIDAASIRAAVRAAAEMGAPEAVFVSCTNLALLDLIAGLEAEIGRPVLSSNQVLAWHMARAAGIAPARPLGGQLFAAG